MLREEVSWVDHLGYETQKGEFGNYGNLPFGKTMWNIQFRFLYLLGKCEGNKTQLKQFSDLQLCFWFLTFLTVWQLRYTMIYWDQFFVMTQNIPKPCRWLYTWRLSESLTWRTWSVFFCDQRIIHQIWSVLCHTYVLVTLPKWSSNTLVRIHTMNGMFHLWHVSLPYRYQRCSLRTAKISERSGDGQGSVPMKKQKLAEKPQDHRCCMGTGKPMKKPGEW